MMTEAHKERKHSRDWVTEGGVGETQLYRTRGEPVEAGVEAIATG
jgi:hypothetical protein